MAQLKQLLENEKVERVGSREFICGTVGPHEVVMQQCGIGKVNSAVGAVEMIKSYAPQLVISSGVAGGADVSLNVGDVVVGSSYCYHDAYCGDECAKGQILGMPAVFEAPVDVVDKALHLNCEETVKGGLIVSGDWFVDSKDKMRAILDDHPEAVAVDMESCSIAQVCHIYGVRFVSFRIISDIPLKDTKASQYFDFWDRMAQGSFDVTRTMLEALA